MLFINSCYSQIDIDSIIDANYSFIENEILKKSVSDKIINENFKQRKEHIRIKIFNEKKENHQIVNIKSFKRLGYDFKEVALVYEVVKNGKTLAMFRLPFNSYKMLIPISDFKSALKPYLLVLEDKIEIDLDDAIQISKNNGLIKPDYWKIYYKKRKLIWLIREDLENEKQRIIKINSKNGKVISDYIEKKEG